MEINLKVWQVWMTKYGTRQIRDIRDNIVHYNDGKMKTMTVGAFKDWISQSKAKRI
jgi:hypothetical protein